MNNLISKFNLYEYFRILIPGSYLSLNLYFLLQFLTPINVNNFSWAIITILGLFSSLLFGALIYSFDLPRLFKYSIGFIPTNLMRREFPTKYKYFSERELEHEYYQWYEKTNNKSKSKTETLSGLYHLSVNLFIPSLVVLLFLCVIPKWSCWYIKMFNFFVFTLSSFSTFFIVNCRLKYQWQRNYWEFRYEYIKEPPEVKSNSSAF